MTPDTQPSLKDRLKSGQTAAGTFLLFLAGGDIAQFLASLGFHYLILDTEHSTFDLPQVRQTILAATAAGVSTIVRIPEVQYSLVTRALDAGADGIMLPRVESRDEVEKLVRFARYAPVGQRGISTFAGHNQFARIPDVPAFLADRNRRILLMAQIETPAGVENRQAILSTPGLDACFVGTGDLAMGMGYAGQPDHPAVLEQAEKVVATAQSLGLLWSLPIRTPDAVARWTRRGMTMLTLSTDGGLLAAGANLFLAAARAAAADTNR